MPVSRSVYHGSGPLLRVLKYLLDPDHNCPAILAPTLVPSSACPGLSAGGPQFPFLDSTEPLHGAGGVS